MDSQLLEGVLNATPEINPHIANGLATKQLLGAEAFIDEIFRCAAVDFPEDYRTKVIADVRPKKNSTKRHGHGIIGRFTNLLRAISIWWRISLNTTVRSYLHDTCICRMCKPGTTQRPRKEVCDPPCVGRPSLQRRIEEHVHPVDQSTVDL